jgi:hypothetical protein
MKLTLILMRSGLSDFFSSGSVERYPSQKFIFVEILLRESRYNLRLTDKVLIEMKLNIQTKRLEVTGGWILYLT